MLKKYCITYLNLQLQEKTVEVKALLPEVAEMVAKLRRAIYKIISTEEVK